MGEVVVETTPAILFQVGDLARRDRVLMDIADDRREVPVRLHHDGAVPSAKQRSVAPMPAVVPLRVHPVDVAHDAGQRNLRGLHTQMVVIPQQTVGEDLQAPAGMHLAEALQEGGAIRIGFEDGVGGQAPVHHMVRGPGELNPQWARHGASVSGQGSSVNQRLDP